MSVLVFEGQAGTGKTTKLLAEARRLVNQGLLGPEQRVLGLTKYHGSRRRMAAILKGPTGVGHSVDCVTLDSFAYTLVRRWQTLARQLALSRASFAEIMAAAAELLGFESVVLWVVRRYPLLIIDELQDCSENEVRLLDRLASHAKVLAAIDAFQDLSGSNHNAAVQWAKTAGTFIRLEQIHRTDKRGILEAAAALRNGLRLPRKMEGFRCVSVPVYSKGGATVSWAIKSRGGKDIAVISPVSRGRSPFVDKLLDWVSNNRATTRRGSQTAGPYTIPWEHSEEDLYEETRVALQIPEEPLEIVSLPELLERARRLNASDVVRWSSRYVRLRGTTAVPADEVHDALRRIIHQRRAFAQKEGKSRVAMTVHQAKNREFEHVIVLWPMAVRSDIEQQRRLLYNAITRARKSVLVVVEDPTRSRLNEPLFAGLKSGPVCI